MKTPTAKTTAVKIEDLAHWTSGVLVAPEGASAVKPASVEVSKISPLRSAKPGSVAFFFSREFVADLSEAQPTVLVTAEPFVHGLKEAHHPILKSAWLLVCKDPYLAMGQLTEKFAGFGADPTHVPNHFGAEIFIHPTAVIEPTAVIGSSVWIGPYVVVGQHVHVGENTRIEAHVTLGDRVVLGKSCRLFPGVHIYPGVKIGDRVRIHSSSVIGADGFGYAQVMDASKRPTAHQKIYHLGNVRIGNDVEIGASSCIDRGTLEDTVIEDQVKIDNNVQIGHNAWMKTGSVICGSAGMAGSSTLGRFSMVGGLTGVSNKVVIGDYARIGAMSIVTKDVKDGDVAAGNPQRTLKDFLKVNAWLNRNALKESKS